MNSSDIAAKLARQVAVGLNKEAKFPAPGIVRSGLTRLSKSRSVPKFVRGGAEGVGRHLVPMSSANVSDTATDLAIGAGMAIASDRIAKHVINKLDEKDKKKP